MWFQNYFTSLTSTPTRRRRTRRSPPGSRLGIETLEDRCLLSFSPVTSFPVGTNPQAVVTGDFNNDDQLDLATANYGANTVSVLLGNGNGTFQPAKTSDARFAYSAAFAKGDFNNDGNLDLATNGTTVLWGNGDGTFQWEFAIPIPTIPYMAGIPLSVAAGDFNADGDTDLAYTLFYQSVLDPVGEIYGGVGVVLSDGQGGFATSDVDLSPYFPFGLVVADLNGDEVPDVVGANYSYSNVSVLLGDGNGTLSFFGSSEFATGPFPHDVAVGEFTGDGIPDLVTAGQRLDVLTGLGDGKFDAPISYSANSAGMTAVAAADFNGDGKLDVVTANPVAGTVSVLLGLGNGRFAPPINHPAGSSPTAVVVGYFNGDSRPDIAVANADSNTVSVLLNDGNWPAVAPTLPGDYNQNGEVDAADYVVWRRAKGNSVTPFTGADGNGDGAVDQADHAVWAAHFGQTLPVPGSGAVVVAQSLVADSHPLDNWRPLPMGEGSNRQTPALAEVVVALSASEVPTIALPAAANGDRARFAPPADFGELSRVEPGAVSRNRLAARSGGTLHVASRHDDALVAWLALQPDTRERPGAFGAFTPQVNEVANYIDGVHLRRIDEAFKLLASD